MLHEADPRHSPFDFAREVKLAPTWLQELVESHESLPWQRRDYLRGAMLDKLTAAAGFKPVAEALPPALEDEREDSVREFLDKQRLGWGAKFAAVFEEIGLETTADLCEATEEEMAELEKKLTAFGAGSFQQRQIRDAVARLRADASSAQPAADPQTLGASAAHQAQQQAAGDGGGAAVVPWQCRKQFAAFLSHHQRDPVVWCVVDPQAVAPNL